jgi:tetratricopeptide (TPR) repeat protein
MTGNVKTLAAYLTISLAVFGAASVKAANGVGGHDDDKGSNGGDVYVRRGDTGDRIGDDGVGDVRTDEFDTVARPRTIIPGSGTVRTVDGTGARVGANIVHRSLGASDYGRASDANFRLAGVNNVGVGSQGAAYSQIAGASNGDATRIDRASVPPEGVYNQFAFGVTAAAVNSADPFNRSVHANRPNMIDADAYNSQFAYWSYGLSSYYGRFSAYENGYSPFVYDSSLYDRRNPRNFNPDYNYAGYGPGELGNPSVATAAARSAVYEYSHLLATPMAAPTKPTVVGDWDAISDVARNAFKAGDYSRARELTDRAIGQKPNDANLQNLSALALFALHRYEDADKSLHAMPSVGQRWDWQKLVDLYSNVSVYTEQLRALEDYCNTNPRTASGRFVLAYFYMTQGNTEVAVDQFKHVIALRPQDDVAARLFRRLEQAKTPAATGVVGPK